MNRIGNLALLATLSHLAQELMSAETDIESLSNHISNDHAQMDEMQRTISDLRRRNEEMYDKLAYQPDVTHIKNENERLYAEVRALKSANHKLVYGEQTEEETATAYMVKKGEMLWKAGNKIGTLKGVRDVSGWGLKVTKDWCEAYMDRKADEKSESGPNTKRSSPVPAGVGTAAKRGA